MRQQSGFTLIELLIVVAIIAILAAIAVPNFLEAQTRSKVTRARADMRSVATAMEAYQVDNNHYPRGVLPNEPGPRERYGWGFLNEKLTTPVAYITEIVIDPFNFYYTIPPDDTAWGAIPNTLTTRFRVITREPYTGPNPFVAPDPPSIWEGVYSNPLVQAGVPAMPPYYMVSPGPDKIEDVLPGYNPVLYDPTNGTTSRGDLVYLGSSSQKY